MPKFDEGQMNDMIEKMRIQLENLHKRAINDLEAEERLRADFERRKTHTLR